MMNSHAEYQYGGKSITKVHSFCLQPKFLDLYSIALCSIILHSLIEGRGVRNIAPVCARVLVWGEGGWGLGWKMLVILVVTEACGVTLILYQSYVAWAHYSSYWTLAQRQTLRPTANAATWGMGWEQPLSTAANGLMANTTTFPFTFPKWVRITWDRVEG